MRFLTGKKVIYVANVDEDHLNEDNDYVREVQQIAAEHNAEFVKLCAKLEQDMAGLSDAERHEFLRSLGIHETGLEQVIHKGYHALGLIAFFTPAPKKCGRGRCAAAPKRPKPPA
jgi:ribosome-binding ATPase YchF (GTP1/OBG family)